MFIFLDFIFPPRPEKLLLSGGTWKEDISHQPLAVFLIFVCLYSWNLLLLPNFPENNWTEAPLFISLTSAIWPDTRFNPASTLEWFFYKWQSLTVPLWEATPPHVTFYHNEGNFKRHSIKRKGVFCKRLVSWVFTCPYGWLKLLKYLYIL